MLTGLNRLMAGSSDWILQWWWWNFWFPPTAE